MVISLCYYTFNSNCGVLLGNPFNNEKERAVTGEKQSDKGVVITKQAFHFMSRRNFKWK